MPKSRHASTTHEEAVNAVLAGRAPVSRLYDADALVRIRTVRRGLPAKAIERFSHALALSMESTYGLLGLSRSTAIRLARENKNLNSETTERAMFIAGLAKAVEEMIPAGRAPDDFDASRWVAQWLGEPQPALGGKNPAAFLDTVDGRQIVRRLLGQIETSTYA